MDSPGDNTAVIRMKRDFDSFLSSSRGRSFNRLDLSRSVVNDDNTNQSQSSLSVRSLLEKEKESLVKDAEIAAAKSQISSLESKVSDLQTSNKRARIEYEKKYDCIKSKTEHELGKINELKAQIKTLAEKEKQLKEELDEYRDQLKNTKTETEKQIMSLHKDKLKLQEEIQQMRESSWKENMDYKNEVIKLKNQLQLSENDLEETQAQLDLQKKRCIEMTSQLKDSEDSKAKENELQQKIKEFELKISLMEEDSVVAATMKSQLLSMPELKEEVKRLRLDNEHLRDIQENNLLLKEQAESWKSRLERMENKYTECAKLEVENAELKSRLEKWETANSDGSKISTPSQLKRQLSHLQGLEAIMLEKQGQLQTSLHSREEEIRTLKQNYETLKEQLTQEQSKNQQYVDVMKRQQRKIVLLSKERDGYKRVIDSYESEVTVNIGAQTASRIQQLEEIVQAYRKQTEQLETELNRVSTEVQNSRSNGVKGNSTMDSGQPSKSVAESEVDQKIILQLRERIASLEKELEKIAEEKFILETRIEQRHLQGDYDPTKTKVLHFSMNPHAIAQKQKAEELKQLKEENEKLKTRLQLLEESGGKVADLTLTVDKKLQEPCSSKEVDEMKSLLSREETKNKRLVEAFKKTSQEFREVCYQLTGYKIDIPCSNQYRLTSMYAESPEDFFLFQQSSGGEIQLLGTQFSETLQDLIDLYLQRQDSIPAFLSSVTLDLFNKQTMNLG